MTLKLIVDGEERTAVGGGVRSVLDPFTLSPFEEVPDGTAADVDQAVAAARAAFDDGRWSTLPPGERSLLLFRLADRLEAESERIAEIESKNVGKALKLALHSDLPFAVDNLRFFASAARHLEGASAGVYDGAHMSWLMRQPIGVVASIAPWNYPVMMAAWKIGPALAAGNTVVLKPAPETPVSSLILGKLALEVGFPPGVLNVVTGADEVGAALVSHPDVDMISLTGSSETGAKVTRAAGLKRVHLELGGKAPMVVFKDANLDAAVRAAVVGATVNTGQDCTAATRIYVERAVFDEVVSRLKTAMGEVRMGNPLSLTTDMGPLSSEDQWQRVSGFVDRAREGGLHVVLGGGRPDGLGRLFFSPTMVVAPPQGSEIVQREVFGPVVVALPFDTEAEAIHMANDVIYGLAASVFTVDHARALRVSAALHFGDVWINDHLPLASEMPHSGHRQSGVGHDLSAYALEDYTNLKHVMSDLSGDVVKPWHFTILGDVPES